MSELQSRLGLTYLFISHNLAVVSHVATGSASVPGTPVEIADARGFSRGRSIPITACCWDAVPDLR